MQRRLPWGILLPTKHRCCWGEQASKSLSTVNIIFVLIITSVQSNPYLHERLHPHHNYHSFVNVVNILKIGAFVFSGKACSWCSYVVPSDGSSTCKEVVGVGTRPPVQIGLIGTAMSARGQKSYRDDKFLTNDNFPFSKYPRVVLCPRRIGQRRKSIHMEFST